MQKTISLFASQRLIELLSNIEHQIAYNLIENIRYRSGTSVSYLDFGSTNDTISFITPNKYFDIQKTNPSDWMNLVWKEKRSEIKIGKLIKMFYKDTYPVNHPKGAPRPKPSLDIESFVNKFKAERDKDVNYDRFELIKGDDFHYWYVQDNYSRFVHEETTLGRSCLRYKESTRYLNIYSKNPDVFQMLILKDDSNKLRGRANVWKLEKPEGRFYMDRIYSVNDYDVELFKDYAKQQGWLYKESQTFGWKNNIVDSRDSKVYKWDEMIMVSSIKKIPGTHFKYYPYIDTLSIFNPNDRTLTNDGRLRVLDPHLVLTDYQGSYHCEIDSSDMVFSEIYNEYIRRNSSVYVEIDDTWVYSDDAVYVYNSGGKHAYINSDKIVKSNIYKTKWFLKEDTMYSEYLNTYIYKESIRTAYLDEEKNELVAIHYKMIGVEFEEKDGVILKKKITPKHNPFTESSELYEIKNIIRNISNSVSSSNRIRRRTRRVDSDNVINEQQDVYISNEEDSDIYSRLNLESYNQEQRDYIIYLLQEERNSSSIFDPSGYRGGLTCIQDIGMGNIIVDDDIDTTSTDDVDTSTDDVDTSTDDVDTSDIFQPNRRGDDIYYWHESGLNQYNINEIKNTRMMEYFRRMVGMYTRGDSNNDDE